MTDRREFLRHSAAGLGVLWAAAVAQRLEAEVAHRVQSTRDEHLAHDERFWGKVRREYTLNEDVINLDHGWSNPAPRAALDQLVREARALEALPAEQLERIFFQMKNSDLRPALAQTLGVDASEIAIVRNATEALNTVLLGVPLRAGDEIVCSAHDYFAMLDALEQRQARDGVLLRMVRPPVPAPTFDALAETYEAAIGRRTKLVLLTHPSNLTGQLLPVRRIAAAAHRVGAEVVVDGAQSFGALDESIASFGCDYYGASAHKWLGAPIGVGVLWMRPTLVPKIWPLVPPPPNVTGMDRFQWVGTAPAYVEPAVLPAIALHRTLGAARKAARLRYLTAHWRRRAAAAVPDARFYTTDEAESSIGLCTIEVPGVDADRLQRRLRTRYAILVQSMAGNARTPEIRGIRITPNVFTTLTELDRFVVALSAAVREVQQ
ncbi:MAG: aminotransferase class V-fold PLP-dependent enzyme [Chloroflexota bacterium]